MNKKMYNAPRIKTLGIETEGCIALSLPVVPGGGVDPGLAESPSYGDEASFKRYDVWDSSSFNQEIGSGISSENSSVWDD